MEQEEKKEGEIGGEPGSCKYCDTPLISDVEINQGYHIECPPQPRKKPPTPKRKGLRRSTRA